MEELKSLPEYLKASNADGTAILEATATWCSQCKAIAPFIDTLIKKYPQARFYKYDTDTALGSFIETTQENLWPSSKTPPSTGIDDDDAEAKETDISQELHATQMPTFHIFKDGDLMGSVTGARTQALEKIIKDNYEGKVEE